MLPVWKTGSISNIRTKWKDRFDVREKKVKQSVIWIAIM